MKQLPSLQVLEEGMMPTYSCGALSLLLTARTSFKWATFSDTSSISRSPSSFMVSWKRRTHLDSIRLSEATASSRHVHRHGQAESWPSCTVTRLLDGIESKLALYGWMGHLKDSFQASWMLRCKMRYLGKGKPLLVEMSRSDRVQCTTSAGSPA